MEPVKKLVLDYSKWRAGGAPCGPNKIGKGATALLNKEGFMCCLGQWACQLGAPLEMLNGMGEPSELGVVYTPLNMSKEDDDDMQWLTENTNLALNCMDINDDQYTSAKDKISRLTEELRKEGIELDVINQPQ